MQLESRDHLGGARALVLAVFVTLLASIAVAPVALAQQVEPDEAEADAAVEPGPDAVGAEADAAVEPGPDAAGADADPVVEPGPDAVGAEADAAVEPGPDAAGADADPVVEPDPEPVVRNLIANDDSVQVIETDVDAHPLVDVVVAVPPALAGELPAEAFSLTENGQVRALDVAKLRDVIEVVVVIDTSGSMGGEPIAAAANAASDFVAALGDDTRLAVVSFGATARTDAALGASRSELDAAISDLEADGETALYDALTVAADEFSDGPARRFVVVLSDGTDTASTASLDDAAAALAAVEANLYAITLESVDADFSGLEALAAQVDGEVVPATNAAELNETYAAIASRLTNQYQLSYRSVAAGEAAIGIAVDANGIIAVASTQVDLSENTAVPDASGADATSGAPEVIPQIDTSNPRVTVTPDASGMVSSANAIYIGAAALFLGVALAVFIAMSAEPKGPSAFERLNFKPRAKRGGIANIADRASMVADRILEKQEKRGALDAALERAGMEMRPGEYVIASLGIAAGMGVFGFMLFGPLIGAAALAVGLVGARMFVNFKASRRQKQFANQLGDTLMMIAGSLRAGHGIVESIDTVAAQADAPTGEEFTRAVAEARIGRDMIDSLYDIADRTGSEDFIWVVRAIGINRELGGDLAEILDNVGETIRDRNRLRDQVRALSAEGKVSAMILFALPIVVGGWVRMSNPEYLDAMTSQTAGKGLVGFAFFALIIGGLWLKKLVKVDF